MGSSTVLQPHNSAESKEVLPWRQTTTMKYQSMSTFLLTLAVLGMTSTAQAFENQTAMYTLQDCLEAFQSLDFVLEALDKYDEYYNPNATYEWTQVGTYTGPEDIAEYVGLVAGGDLSPYVSKLTILSEVFIPVLSEFDPVHGKCVLLHPTVKEFQFRPETTKGGIVVQADLAKLTLDVATWKI